MSLKCQDESDKSPQRHAPGLARDGATSINTIKAKRRQLLPQDSIDRMWKRFSEPVFQMAFTVLPSDTAVVKRRFNWSNDLLSLGYKRAAEDCFQAVQSVVQQCTKFNMRYRDEWDLDWDLKWGNGDCLNSLGEQTFHLDDPTSFGSDNDIPSGVKRVSEIFQKPTFLATISGDDVRQGNLGNCWLVAALTALANTNGGIEKICISHDAKIGVYGFVFYRDGEWIYTLIDDKLYLKSPCWNTPSIQRDLMNSHAYDKEGAKESYRKMYQTGSGSLFFAHCKDQNETWAPLVEKAYAKVHGDYASLDTGWMGEGLEDLTGGVATQILTSDILDTQEYWDTKLSRVNTDFLFGVSAGVLEDGYGERNGISEGHAYVIMDVFTLKSGQRLVKLGNPWGNHEGKWRGAWSDGSKEWTREAQEELTHRFGQDSTFWMSYEDLLDRMTCFDQTRLFLDPEWRCCQRWASIPVPWQSNYHKAFLIQLTVEASPLVLVISQLDRRYFKGLHGEYSFRLHFQLHDENGGTNDFGLSHGNYLMSRSVSLEIPDLPPGDYAVSLKITTERDPNAKSVEEIVLRECEERTNNEKLVQVGSAYDMAHRKSGSLCDLLVDSEDSESSDELTVYDDTACEPQGGTERDGDLGGKRRPWNAVCVVGIRVYSKDKQLQVQTIGAR